MTTGGVLRFVRSVLPCAAIAAIASPALAEPQWNAGILAGAAGLGRGSGYWQDGMFYGALHGDVLFARTSPRSLGIGPSLELGTAGFADARVLGGATLLVPVSDLFALAATPGAYARYDGSGRAGVSGRLFFGAKAHNYHGSYALAGGLVVGLDQDLGPSGVHTVVIAAQLDAMVFVMIPVLLLGHVLTASGD